MRFWYILFFIIIISSNSVSQVPRHTLYRETMADTLGKQLNNILILGIGSTPSRIFLDNLSEKLINKFESANVKAEYRYLGKTVAEAREDSNLNQVKDFKAVLLFIPRDSSFFEVKITKNNFSIPRLTNSNEFITRNFIYEGNFDIRLYTTEEEKKLIWTAFTDVTNQLTKTSIYSKISKKIISDFKKNGYIR